MDDPAPVLRVEGDADIRLVLDALDNLTTCHEVGRDKALAAYDLLLRLRCRMGSDGRWRQGPGPLNDPPKESTDA